jgi:hypothetical protein
MPVPIRDAAMSFRAEFFAPEIRAVPESRRPPSMKNELTRQHCSLRASPLNVISCALTVVS